MNTKNKIIFQNDITLAKTRQFIETKMINTMIQKPKMEDAKTILNNDVKMLENEHLTSYADLISLKVSNFEIKHNEIVKSRAIHFFDELTDLIKIDNAYRGVNDVLYYNSVNTNYTDTIDRMKIFFEETTKLINEDNIYRGITAEQFNIS